MKLQDWIKREDLQAEWKKLWSETEVLQKGLAVLQNVALPQETRAPQGIDPIHYNALLNARREGYYDALRNLEALGQTKPPTETLPDPWSETKQEGA